MPKIPEDRPEQLAINLLDLDRVDEGLRAMLLLKRLDLKRAIRPDPKGPVEDTIIPFKSELLDAATACDVLASEHRKHDEVPVRLSIKRNEESNWIKLPYEVVLTVIINGRPRLNPRVFGAAAIHSHEAIPLPTVRVEF